MLNERMVLVNAVEQKGNYIRLHHLKISMLVPKDKIIAAIFTNEAKVAK